MKHEVGVVDGVVAPGRMCGESHVRRIAYDDVCNGRGRLRSASVSSRRGVVSTGIAIQPVHANATRYLYGSLALDAEI